MQVHQTPTLLLTRPRPASERFAQGMEGAEVVIAPLMEIVGTGAKVDLDGATGLILTSEAATAFLPQTTLPAYCVGPRTAEAARGAGLEAQVLGPDADGLVGALADRRTEGRLVHLHGAHTRGDIAGRLSDAGLHVTGIAVYDQRALDPGEAFADALRQPNLIVPLFSPRSAKLFASAARALREDAKLIALSGAVADALPQAMQRQCVVSPAPTGAAMVQALAQLGVQRNCP